VIISSDKITLSQFSGDKVCYPVYITIGNIDKAMRAKPSWHGWQLLAYLPMPKLDNKKLSQHDVTLARFRLFHHCMKQILALLGAAGCDGLHMTSGDGAIYHTHPIVASYVADYPEQCLVTLTRQSTNCPRCHAPWSLFGDLMNHDSRCQKETLVIIQAASRLKSVKDIEEFLQEHGLNFVLEPFWETLTHTNIHRSITSDVLHQVIGGVLPHLISWLQELAGTREIDNRFACLPPGQDIRTFLNGISGLSNVSGHERKEMCKQLLGCIIDLPGVPNGALRITRALLDFVYLAQYPMHTTTTLGYLDAALEEFHRNKEVFVNLGAREGWSNASQS
jgi:hypothetical protein